ncbi:hypothetical protein AB0E59_23310 [Lentzea sp. NPDC034063]
MATDPLKPVPVPVPHEPKDTCWPQNPVRGVDWFRRMPTGGGTVYVRPAD